MAPHFAVLSDPPSPEPMKKLPTQITSYYQTVKPLIVLLAGGQLFSEIAVFGGTYNVDPWKGGIIRTLQFLPDPILATAQVPQNVG